MISSRPMLAAYDIGGPQLLSGNPRAASCSKCGFFRISSFRAFVSPRQIASVVRQAVTTRQGKLRIGELGLRRLDGFGIVFAQFRHGCRVVLTNGSQQVFRLVAKLVEVRADRKVTIVEPLRHDGPPLGRARGPLQRAKGGSLEP